MLQYFFDHQPDERAYSNRVRNELVRLVLHSGYSSNFTVMILAVALVVMVRQVAAPRPLWGWFAGMVALFCIKLAATFCYRSKGDDCAPSSLRCVELYILAVALTGLMWGLAVVLFFTPNAVMEQVAIIFIAAGLSAGAIPILSPLRKLYYVYTLSILPPLTVMLILQRGQYHEIMASIIILYGLMLIKSAGQMSRSLTSSLEMSFANAELAEHLKQARDKSEALNVELLKENERRRETERDLLQARDAAEAANQAKNEFLANMSHEIRTPMNGVLGTLQLLRESELQQGQRELLTTAHDSAESLLQILNDILDFSKIEAGKLKLEQIPFRLPTLIESLGQTMTPLLAARRISFAREIDPQLGDPLLGDPVRVRQVLNNLLSNAVKFTAQGKITVRAMVVNRVEEDLLVRLEVVDTGIGIAEADQEKLFQSFSQADTSLTRRYGGTGLGLAIVRQLVTLMDGCCGLESRLAAGSRFWCEIPFARAVGAAAEETAPASPRAASNLSGHLLLAEDNAVNRKIAVAMLEKMGLRVTVAENGQQALDQLDQNAFAVVLMDCQMPEVDGYAATRAWREREAKEARPHTPIIAMTAHAMAGDRERCLAAGMDDYLAKPVKKEALSAMLEKWLPRAPAA